MTLVAGAPLLRSPRRSVLACAAAALLAAPRPAVAQAGACTTRHPMVADVRFRGTRALPKGEIAPIIATERTGLWRRWFGWRVGPLTCLDSLELRLDEVRIHDLYAERGFPGTTARASVARRGERRAEVTFTITEGAPMLIDSIAITGVPPEATDVRRFERRLRRAPLDSVVLAATRDSIQALIRAAGYARARAPELRVMRDSAAGRATVTLAFRPDRVIWVGAIRVNIQPDSVHPALDERDVLALLRFKTGDRFNTRQIGASQRDLYELGLYRAVRLDTVPATGARSDTLSVEVYLVQGDRHRVRAGGGWGTLDCFRAQTRFVDQNVARSGHRLELNARLSKIGIADPFSGLSSLCVPRLRDDPFSQRLNYYAGARLDLRGLLGANLRPSLTVYGERRSEVGAFEQSTDLGAIASLTRELAPRFLGTLQVQYVDSRTAADGAVSCTRFGFCRLEDLRSFLVSSPILSLGVGLVKNPLLPTDDPASGHRWQLEVRQGYTKIARTQTLNFTRVMGEAAVYRPVGAGIVLALRAQLGFVFAPNDRSYLLPPQERFYSGGQSTVRGYEQNLLGPGSFIVDQYHDSTLADGTMVGVARPADGYRRIAPSGGNAIWLANVELRTRRGWPGDLLRWVAFVDAGRVWNTNDVFSVTNATPRVTPGIGVRLLTPLGPFRVDVGYNPNVLDAGPAFFVQQADAATGSPGRAICVSPGTTEPIAMPALGAPLAGVCPATFLPETRRGLLPRLAFQFSIGHAF